MRNQTKPNDQKSARQSAGIQKVPTRIEGLDDILRGGLPAGKITLFSGRPGTGKTVFGLEFLYRGALSGEPGIFLSFEETADGIRQNMRGFGWDLTSLEASGTLFIMEGRIDPEMAVSGDFSIQGLLAIVAGKSQEMGAKRIVIDALDVLIRVFNDPGREAQQLLLLHRWLTKQGLTVVLTTKNLKTSGYSPAFEHLDFMADCVIYLDQRLREQVNTRRIQVVKYRGSGYGSNEYPFLIAEHGMFVSAISDMWLNYEAPSQRLSSGSSALDDILGGGYLKGTCILISGATGTGKTSVASTFARSACTKGRKVLYVNFEESVNGMVAGMRSLGLDLGPAMQEDLLWVRSVMPESRGIEEHLYDKIAAIRSFQPEHVVVDAISACKRIAGEKASFDFIMRLVHLCKQRGLTIILINQTRNAPETDMLSGIGVSSIIDTIINLYYKDIGNETKRELQVIKSRGSKHSNRHHPFLLTGDGIQFGGGA
jgi:circadian clock protein KaiC